MTIRQTFFVLLLLLLAGIVVILNQQEYVPGQTAARDDGRDAFAETVSLTVLNTDGRPAYEMTASAMTHHDGTDLLVLQDPRLNITRPDGATWKITAPRGEASDDGNRVWLPGAVQLARAPVDGLGAMQIEAIDVLVYPREKRIRSDRKVIISSDRYRVEAIGLEADFNDNRLELKSAVKGRHHGAG